MKEIMNVENPLPLMREGVLYVNKKPLYIIEYLDEPGSLDLFVTVYGVSPNSDNENPRKSYKRVKEKPEFKTTTPLGKLAHQTLNVESKYRDKEDPPIFMEMAVEGVDTFTKKEGLGFYERGQDKFEQRDGEPHVVRGERTGVFISFHSVTWKRSYVPTGKILENANAQKELWFNL